MYQREFFKHHYLVKVKSSENICDSYLEKVLLEEVSNKSIIPKRNPKISFEIRRSLLDSFKNENFTFIRIEKL